MTADATVVIVAQRVSTIADADQIIVLDDGVIVGIGRHDELLATCPTYVEIVETQLPRRGGRMSTPDHRRPVEEHRHERPTETKAPRQDADTVSAARGMAAQRRGGGPPWAGAGQPVEKAKNFGPSARRLVGRLRPERWRRGRRARARRHLAWRSR